MISEQEQVQIRLLSDNELYSEAVKLMRSIGRPLPPTQINGLLNVSLANTYDQLKQFVEHQCARTTWAARDRHIPDFYRKLTGQLTNLEKRVPSIIKLRQEKPSPEDVKAIQMALAHEFIQHLLAENAYRVAMKDFDTTNGKQEHQHMKNQSKPYNREGQRR